MAATLALSLDTSPSPVAVFQTHDHRTVQSTGAPLTDAPAVDTLPPAGTLPRTLHLSTVRSLEVGFTDASAFHTDAVVVAVVVAHQVYRV